VKIPTRHRKQEQELQQEIRAHLDMATRDRIDCGESAADAEHSAHREFGNVALVEHVTRDQWGWIWLHELGQDLRYGLRIVRRNPGFTSIAVLTLVLGIGANTAMFSLVNGVLLQPLPFPAPDRLVGATIYFPKGAFAILRDRSRTMDIIANTDSTEFNLTGKDLPVRLTGTSVSAKWFSTVGTQAARGRVFQEGEDQPGNENVVILSHSLWERRFSSDPNIIGRSIILDNVNRQVVGVMPASFRWPSPKTELWVPLDLDSRKIGDYWGSSYMPIIARLKPGATVEQARTEIKQLRLQVLASYAWRMPDDTWQKVSIAPLHELLVGDVRERLLLLLGAVSLLLLIACANVANLLLARATTRQERNRAPQRSGRRPLENRSPADDRERAHFPSRRRARFGAAIYGLQMLKSMLPADMPRLAEVTVDSASCFSTALLSIATGIIFGLAPVGGTSRLNLTKALKTGDRGGISGTHRLSSLLVAGEVGLSVVLVIAAGLLVKSLWNLSNANPGFRAEKILTARVTPNQSFCAEAGRCQMFYRDLVERVRAVPGVSDVATVNGLPLTAPGTPFHPTSRPGRLRRALTFRC
jgi:hypothetical protein